MPAIIVRSNQAAGLSGEGAVAATGTGSLAMRLRQARSEHPASVAAAPHREPAGYVLAGLRAGRRDHALIRGVQLDNPARMNFCRPFGRPAALLPGNARVESLQKSERCAAYVLHGFNSFRDAPAFHEQESTGAEACGPQTKGISNP